MTVSQGAIRLTPWVDDPTWGILRARVCAWLWARNQGMQVVLGPDAGASFRAKAQWLSLDWDDVSPGWHDLDGACLGAARELLTQGRARLVQFETGEIIWWRAELVDQSEVAWDDLVAGACSQSPGSGWGLYAGLRPDLSGGRPGPELLAVLADRAIGITHLMGSTGELLSSARYLAIARELGGDLPLFAHLAAVPDDLGVNLSRLERESYVGPAVAAYAATMGWQPRRHTECLSLADLVSLIDLKDAGEMPSRFDPQRLLAFNRECLKRQVPDISSDD